MYKNYAIVYRSSGSGLTVVSVSALNFMVMMPKACIVTVSETYSGRLSSPRCV